MMPPLVTARLELRPCTADDVDALHALWTEPGVRRYLWDDRSVSRDEAEQVVEAMLASAAQYGYGMWMLCPRSHTNILGFCSLRLIEGTEEVELIYGLAPHAWGQGLATEASRAVLQYGFETLGLPRLWARTDPPNTASLRVIHRLGMQSADNPGHESQPIVAFCLERPT